MRCKVSCGSSRARGSAAPGPPRAQCAGAAAAAWGTRWRSRGGTPRPGRAIRQVLLSWSSLLMLGLKYFVREPVPSPSFPALRPFRWIWAFFPLPPSAYPFSAFNLLLQVFHSHSLSPCACFSVLASEGGFACEQNVCSEVVSSLHLSEPRDRRWSGKRK